ncbi:MAG TPA: FAD-dependent oxidoreductase [Thermoleophilaceae bacterium]
MTAPANDSGLSRRRFIRDTAVAGAGLAALPGASAAAARPKRRTRRTVAIFGAGVGGLTAAQEMRERGFDVVVYERKALGGKSRSNTVPGSARGGRRELPGEHGLRFVPGFYHNLPDTMRRIPVAGNENGVEGNLIATRSSSFARDGGREDLVFPPDSQEASGESLFQWLNGGFTQGSNIPPQEIAYLSNRLAIFFSSSDERRLGQWEHVSWWDYLNADRRSEEYRRLLVNGVTRNFVAAKPQLASTRTIGRIFEAFAYTSMRRDGGGEFDRVLNAPTNEAWIDPWVKHLRKLGVRFRSGTVRSLALKRGRIASACVRDSKGRTRTVDADWFVCAMPGDRARSLWTPALRRADPRLDAMRTLQTAWANGIQFYLRDEVPVLHGHISYVDSPWALTSLSQAQMWEGRDFARDYGDGSVRDCLSVTLSDWDDPGILFGRPASRCTPDEISQEVWAQVKAHLEDTGRTYLPEGVLHSYHLDPAISYKPRRPGDGGVRARNDEPLMLNAVGSWSSRPEARTAIPNLFLAADYVKVDIDLATMEGANEAARAATNALLDASGSNAPRAEIRELYRPPEFEEAKRQDAERFARGEPHVLDVPEPT